MGLLEKDSRPIHCALWGVSWNPKKQPPRKPNVPFFDFFRQLVLLVLEAPQVDGNFCKPQRRHFSRQLFFLMECLVAFLLQHPLDLSPNPVLVWKLKVDSGVVLTGNLGGFIELCWVHFFLDPTETNFPHQVIQAVTYLSHNVGGHKQPVRKGHVFTIPKKCSLHPSWFHDSPFMTCFQFSFWGGKNPTKRGKNSRHFWIFWMDIFRPVDKKGGSLSFIERRQRFLYLL